MVHLPRILEPLENASCFVPWQSNISMEALQVDHPHELTSSGASVCAKLVNILWMGQQNPAPVGRWFIRLESHYSPPTS